jgi:hypothetical protein
LAVKPIEEFTNQLFGVTVEFRLVILGPPLETLGRIMYPFHRFFGLPLSCCRNAS